MVTVVLVVELAKLLVESLTAPTSAANRMSLNPADGHVTFAPPSELHICQLIELYTRFRNDNTLSADDRRNLWIHLVCRVIRWIIRGGPSMILEIEDSEPLRKVTGCAITKRCGRVKL